MVPARPNLRTKLSDQSDESAVTLASSVSIWVHVVFFVYLYRRFHVGTGSLGPVGRQACRLLRAAMAGLLQ